MYVIQRVLSWYGLLFAAIVSLTVLYHVLVNEVVYIMGWKIVAKYGKELSDQQHNLIDWSLSHAAPREKTHRNPFISFR